MRFALAAVLVVLPLFAQQRRDCVSEEVMGDRFYDVCGSDLQTLEGYKDRVALAGLKGGLATIEALREIVCDVAAEDTTVRAIVHRNVSYAADEAGTDENTLLALIESGVVPFFQLENPRRTSDRGVVRLERVVADHHAGDGSRCWALELLVDARGNGAALPWINDRSDPIQSCAAPFALKELSNVARHEVLTHPEHPLHLELILREPVTEATIGSLCHAATDPATSPLDRARAIEQLQSAPGSAGSECLASLLQSERWFVFSGRHSVEIVLESLFVVDRARAKLLAASIDTSSIADPDLRQSVDETLFDIRSYDPDAPFYDDQVPPQGEE